MCSLYLAKLKERGLFWKGQARMVQGEITPNAKALSFYETRKISSLVKFE